MPRSTARSAPSPTFGQLAAHEAGPLLLVPYGGRRPRLPPARGSRADFWSPRGGGVVSGPLLTPDLLDLAEETIRYRAPIGTTLAAMLPPGIESRLERRWELLQPEGDAAAGTVLTESEPADLRPPSHALLAEDRSACRLASPATAGRAS